MDRFFLRKAEDDDAKRAEQAYQHILPTLAGHEGCIVAIELDSGAFFIAEHAAEAYEKASKQYPHKSFVFTRIGK